MGLLFLFIGIGGFIGACSRYYFSLVLNNFKIFNIQLGTILVNIIGSFILGILYVILNKYQIDDKLKLMLTTGIMGAFTTFSTFSMENYELLLQQNYFSALLYSVLSVLLGVGAFALAVKTFS